MCTQYTPRGIRHLSCCGFMPTQASPKHFSALAITHHRMKTSRSRAASAKKNTLAPLQDSTTAAGSGQHACQLPVLLLLARALAAASLHDWDQGGLGKFRHRSHVNLEPICQQRAKCARLDCLQEGQRLQHQQSRRNVVAGRCIRMLGRVGALS